MLPDCVRPQKLEIRKDGLRTLNDFQKLLGDINWLRPFLKIPTMELKPLFAILEGDAELTSPRSMTPAARRALRAVEEALQTAQLRRIDPSCSFALCVLQTRGLPTAVLWQQGPLMWVHPGVSPNKIIEWYPKRVAQIAFQGIKLAISCFGKEPADLFVPYTAHQVQVLTATSDDWAILVSTFWGRLIIITLDTQYYSLPHSTLSCSLGLLFYNR